MSAVLQLTPTPAGAPPPAAVPEGVRVSVHIGNYFVDTTLSEHAPLSVVMEGLVPFLIDVLHNEALTVAVNPNAVYSLAFEGGMPLPRTMTLAEAGVYTGARLIVREVRSAETFKPIIEDAADALAEFNAVKFPAFSAATAHTLGLVTAAAGGALVSVLAIAGWWRHPALVWWLPFTLALTLAALAGSAVAQRRRGAAAASYAVGIAAVLLAFGAGWVAVPPDGGVPGHWTAANALAAAFASGLVAAMVLWLTGVGATVHTAAITAAGAAAVAAAAATFTALHPRQLAVGALLAGMIVIAAAPGLALGLARVRPPSLPPPGESLDRNELEDAALVVEVFEDAAEARTVALSGDAEDTEMQRGKRLANKYLTGMYVAAVVIVAAGAVAALEPGTHYYGGEVALAVIAAAVLFLRGRSTTDRVQAVGFFVGAFVVLGGSGVVAVLGAGRPAVALAITGAVAAGLLGAAAAGLLLPGRKLSPIVLRRIEYVEFLQNMAIPVLAFWVLGIFAALRDLH